ncbi:MAG TPA: FAD-binding oxidoreductase [Longimicrobiales bacterium]|nr:FAD-binding oxidoreductase [Longimicrobiales bacterium]
MKYQALRDRLGSQLITVDDSRYDSARRVWNGMIDRRPAAVVQCRGVADVVAAVEFARDQGMLLAVRGGGHSVAGFGTCDDGVVVDLSPMRSVRVDATVRRVRVGGGATLGDMDRETQVFGLAVPGGIVSTTGVAGLTLGSGQGWLRRTYGMACDSLVSADVVTAAGELVTASETVNPDLFWALRGGGGNFGVVTSLEFQAHPVGPMIAFAGPCYPLESAASVIAGMRQFAEDAPDEVNVSATWWMIPALSSFPEDHHGRIVITLGATYVGPPEKGERVLQPLREIEEPLLDLSTTLPYIALQQMFDPFFPAHELQYYWKSAYLADLGEDATRTIAEHVAARPSAKTMVGTWALGGALGRVDAPATAAGAEGAPYLLEILANWADPDEADANIDWARTFFDAMRPYGTGKTNVNFPGLGDDAEFGRAAFGDNWGRLVEVKRKYDPTNLFRQNQNIQP